MATERNIVIPKLRRMKAAIFDDISKKLEVVQTAIPAPNSTQVLIKMAASGCCHTDIHAIDGDWDIKPKRDLCPGHEGVGVVVEVGSQATNCKVGDRVGMAWLHSTCGHCEFCTSGWETLCPEQENTGYSVNGAFAEFALAQDAYTIHIPDGVDNFQAAPILCAGVTSYKALKCTEAKPGQFVAIIGAAGGLGHLAIQYAKAMGLRVIALDVGREKLDYCKSLGADRCIDSKESSQTISQLVQDFTSGGCHGVLCLAPQKAAFDQSILLCRRRGTIVCVGLPSGSFEIPVIDTVLRGITVRGSIVGTRQDNIEALEFAARGLVKCDIEKASLDDVNKVIDRVRKCQVKGRIVFEF